MALSTRVWGAGKRLLLAGALVLTYFLFAAASMRLAIKTRDVVVPPLTRQDGQRSEHDPADSGLNLKVEETRRIGRRRSRPARSSARTRSRASRRVASAA